MATSHSPRRPRPLTTHKHRISAVRLSTDTTSSLPAYSSPTTARPALASDWPDSAHSHLLDEPPDYPESAEEADQEDDFVPLRLPRPTATRRSRHRRTESYSAPTSPSVDDLLERSVVALELSTNALLQSMDTQSSITAIANDQILERSLDRQTRMLDLRLRGSRSTHEDWMDELDDVMKRVNGLFADQTSPDAGISQSLPTGSSHMPRRQHHRHDFPKSSSSSAYLHLSNSELDLRDTLRPPRALTQYVSVESTAGDASEATADPGSIYLPSTTGLRSVAQIRSFGSSGPHPPSLHKSISSPGPELCSTPPTPAYNMLSQLVSHASRSPSRNTTPPASQRSPSLSDSTASRTIRRHSASSMDSTFTFPNSLRRSRSTSRGRYSISTEPPPPLPSVRTMTPPMEELTPSSSGSCSSAHQVNAFRTMQSLRKILDEAPDPKGKRPVIQEKSPRPIFRPRTPAVAASSSTSTATASVSRLFTRSSHHTSSSHRSRPKQSSLKHSRSKPSTPVIPCTPVDLTPSSRLSSAPSTPRQVSFADLPEAHSGRSLQRGKDKGKGKKEKAPENGWWVGWFTSASGPGAARHDERMEDKMMRGWGRPGVGGGVTDEWML